MNQIRQFLTILLFGCALTMFGSVVPKNSQTLELSAGWNLVALEGVPLRMQEFLELRPMVYEEDSHSYIMGTEETTFQRGMALWIFSDVAKSVEVPLVSASVATPEAQLGVGWNLVGTADAEPPWLERVVFPLFKWDVEQGRFMSTETPEAEQGYWVKLK